MESGLVCNKCHNDNTVIKCEHFGSALSGVGNGSEYACTECEFDPNCVLLEGNCFFCICGGKPDKFDCKAKYMFNTALEAALLGQKRRAKGLPPAILSEKAAYHVQTLHKLFMIGYDTITASSSSECARTSERAGTPDERGSACSVKCIQ